MIIYYVTGEHLIQDPITGRFIPVSQCSLAEKTNIQDDVLSCLVTENHTIPVGEFIFLGLGRLIYRLLSTYYINGQ